MEDETQNENLDQFTLHLRHHYKDHYSQLIKVFGSLRDVWMMRFEGKHKFFKQVICHTKNFKNVPQTLAVWHQRIVAYHLDSSSFFKPTIKTDKVTATLVSTFPESVQDFIKQTYANLNTRSLPHLPALMASSTVQIWLFLLALAQVFLNFSKLRIIVINTDFFVCKQQTAWCIEQLRSYELYPLS